MSKFYVGQKVLVTGSTNNPKPETRDMIGSVCEIRNVFSYRDVLVVYTPDKTRYWWFNPDDLQPITEIPEALTINGVEYIRKPEPVVEHEWKFGDVATHEKYGVGIVTRIDGCDAKSIFFDRPMGNTGVGGWFEPSSLTFIRRADLSV